MIFLYFNVSVFLLFEVFPPVCTGEEGGNHCIFLLNYISTGGHLVMLGRPHCGKEYFKGVT